jgi:SAM-dependent methyltransferase
VFWIWGPCLPVKRDNSLLAESDSEGVVGINMEPDDISDEGYAESSAASLLSTVPSEVRRLKEEHGRLWAAYGKNEYYLPIDDEELDRLDLNHYKYTMLLDDALFLSPVGEHPQNILDLGTGTGIWAIDVADKLPSANVIGTDIAPIQPAWVPPNCTFQIDDAEEDWTFKDGTFDLIHSRDFCQAIRDWPRLIRQSYKALRPGGYLEFHGVYPVLGSDDKTIPENSGYQEMTTTYQHIAELIKAEPDAVKKWKRWFDEVGFQEVKQRIYRIPSSPWPKDPTLKKIGAYELANVLQGAQGFLIRGYTEKMGKTREEMEMMLFRMRKELLSGKMHYYVPYYVVYGRKPG